MMLENDGYGVMLMYPPNTLPCMLRSWGCMSIVAS
jgi:hypothetical protein